MINLLNSCASCVICIVLYFCLLLTVCTIIWKLQPVFSPSVLAETMRPDGSSTVSVISGESLSAELAHELMSIQVSPKGASFLFGGYNYMKIAIMVWDFFFFMPYGSYNFYFLLDLINFFPLFCKDSFSWAFF